MAVKKCKNYVILSDSEKSQTKKSCHPEALAEGSLTNVITPHLEIKNFGPPARGGHECARYPEHSAEQNNPVNCFARGEEGSLANTLCPPLVGDRNLRFRGGQLLDKDSSIVSLPQNDCNVALDRDFSQTSFAQNDGGKSKESRHPEALAEGSLTNVITPHLEIKNFGPPARGGHAYSCHPEHSAEQNNPVNCFARGEEGSLANTLCPPLVGDRNLRFRGGQLFGRDSSQITFAQNDYRKKKAVFTLAEGTTHVDTPPTLAKAGFTLAEVLITLGIIGVVAAMTIPNLMTNYRKHIIETRLIKFYSTINQAIKLAEYDHDDRTGWDEMESGFVKDEDGNDTDEPAAYSWVMKYIVPYLKSDAKKVGTDSYYVNLYFMDGSMVSVNKNSWIFFPDSSKYKAEYVTTEGQKEVIGKYAFIFYYNPNHKNASQYNYVGVDVEPYKYAWDGTREGLFNGAYGCGKSGVIGAYCTELIHQSGWKIPNDYPIKPF